MLASVARRFVLGGLLFMLIPGAAFAKPIILDSPNDGSAPLVAYDHGTGTTYVAWGNGTSPNAAGISLCVIAANQSGCTGGAPVTLSDPFVTQVGGTVGIGGLVVEPNGDAVVLGSSSQGGVGTVAWASAPGGAGFLSAGNGLQNAGMPISGVSLYYTIGNAVSLGDSDVGLLDDYGGFFSDSLFSGPASPAITATDGNSNPGGYFTRKPLDAAGADVGAEPTPGVPGSETVIGVADNVGGDSYRPPGCTNTAATAYGLSVGAVNGSSNAAGTLNGEGIPNYGVLDCSARAPAIASGGNKGMGVLEEEGPGLSGGTDIRMVWRPFNATSTGGSFGGPVKLQDVTNHVVVSAFDVSVVEDATAGVYAQWVDEQGLVLDYSPNGGVTWYPPVIGPRLSPDAQAPTDPQIVGLGSGVFDIVFDHDPGSGTRIYSDVVAYKSLVSRPLTLPGRAKDKSSAKFPITAVCSSACSVTVTVTGAGKAKALKIATGKFSIKAAGKHKFTLKFTRAGRKLFVKDHGKLKGTILGIDKAPFGTFKDTKLFRITKVN
jgi:hypothetical protein